MLEAVAPLDVMPQCIRIEHEARARHDVGPVARLILLQQPQALMLLREQPLDGESDARGIAPLEPTRQTTTVEEIQGDEPPQRRVDAAEVPEIRLALLRCNELGDLAILRLMPRKGAQRHHRCPLERRIARSGHAEGADGGIAPEDGRVAALLGACARRCRKDAGRSEIALQQRDGAIVTLGEQAGFAGAARLATPPAQSLSVTFTLRPSATAARLMVAIVTEGSSAFSRRWTTARLVRMRRASSD